jgi:NAD-dependent deacetylase
VNASGGYPTYQIPAELIERLRGAEHVAVLTGAGISAESGVPTFRDAQTGLWARFSPEELATRDAFRRNPKMVWEWYAYRRQLVSRVQPNPGHLALAEIEARVPRFTLITQNVDGLHQQGGSKCVLELHGNIRRCKCFDHNHPAEVWDERGEIPPRCPQCRSLLRPDVVWFGEDLPVELFYEAERAAKECALFLTIGTAAAVFPAAELPYTASQEGAFVVEINPNPTDFTPRANWAFQEPAGQFLPALVKAVWPLPPRRSPRRVVMKPL